MNDTSQRASFWQLRKRRIEFLRQPALMGIVNVTPDSFSDGGQFDNAAAAVDHALQLADDGAAILDIGGESTRPYAEEVSTQEELGRVLPVIERLAKQTTVPISIDTSSAAVARAAIDAGAEIINDVTGLTGDSEMLEVAVSTNVGVCAMHMQGTPQTMQDDPQYADVVAEIHEYLQGRLDQLIEHGIEQSRICLDPGIGFGKSHQHNLQLLKSCRQFHTLGTPLLVGHSRKGFIAHILDDRECERTSGTIGTSIALALQGVQILRVHDVAEVQRALTMFYQSTG
ncbi:dihydropteroate synthase [Pirellulaceae bacterium]|jgi:dihydropteroate synthase|nr:dihydropteroate synthase [Pirellulaceae bacterium]